MPKPKALISWSSGKDSAWALHLVRESGEFEIVGALTTVNDKFGRVSMHGLRTELLLAQVEAARLEPVLVHIPYPCTNAIYEAAMAKEVEAAKQRGITHIIFGDLFLQDIRDYRETKLAGTGITPVFPVWLLPTEKLPQDMIDSGVEAYLTAVDLKKLPAEFAGRLFDRALLRDLPPGVDPCGENGEFHSFVAAGPMLARRIPVRVGETAVREGFAYADLVRSS
jgi:diphthamide synthase (EF-2-diphthine--ammonia ligase)